MDTITIKARTARQAADEFAHEAREAFDRTTDRAADTYASARDVMRQVDPFLRNRTYLSLGLAALIGLIVGGLFLPRGPKVIYVKSGD
jgi:ElaB/YqjD/DUF883 family membrane-anchored ribosome-binding protein